MSPSKPRILVVENHSLMVKLARWILEKNLACDVDIVATDQALECFKHHAYDLVLVGIESSDTQSYILVEAMRKLENNRHTPIIASAVYLNTEHMEKIKDAEIDAVFEKPFTIEQAKEIINQYTNFSTDDGE
jgi:CheY-like chemotaxis protein